MRRSAGLNDSGEDGISRIFDRGALHFSRGQHTTSHAHYAWKLHVGIDAPVWLRSADVTFNPSADVRAVLVPPGVQHTTGAVGWSLAVFLAPGGAEAPSSLVARGWRASGPPKVLSGVTAERICALCRGFDVAQRSGNELFANELTKELGAHVAGPTLDARVQAALAQLDENLDTTLSTLARRAGLSLDRLSKLTSQGTGFGLRRHVLWRRVIGFLSTASEYDTIAAGAAAMGFSDHAHMTRTFRQCLGRVPSEFSAPPDAVGKW